MDPQQRLLPGIAYEAVEDTGIPLPNIQGTETAVYTGMKCLYILSDLHDHTRVSRLAEKLCLDW